MASRPVPRIREFKRKTLKDPIVCFPDRVLWSAARFMSHADANKCGQPSPLTPSRQVRRPHFFNKRQKLSSLSRFPAYSLQIVSLPVHALYERRRCRGLEAVDVPAGLCRMCRAARASIRRSGCGKRCRNNRKVTREKESKSEHGEMDTVCGRPDVLCYACDGTINDSNGF
jgi:hypothetical protein